MNESLYTAPPPRQYRIYAKKWDWRADLGEGYSLDQARSIAAVLYEASKAARPREGSWTLPYFGFEPVEPPVAAARAVGDIAFYRVDSHFHYALDGSVVSFARYFRAGLVATISPAGKILAVETFDGECVAAPTICCSFERSALDLEGALVELRARHARYRQDGHTGLPWGCCHSVEEACHLLRPFVLARIQATAVDTSLARQIIESHGLPPGHSPAMVDSARLQADVDAVFASPRSLLAA